MPNANGVEYVPSAATVTVVVVASHLVLPLAFVCTVKTAPLNGDPRL